MLFWLLLAAALARLLWTMIRVPGESHRGPLPALTEEERRLAPLLRRHVEALASREHNLFRPAELEAAARYLETALAGMGYAPQAQRFQTSLGEARNIEVEVRGSYRYPHYHSAADTPDKVDYERLARVVTGLERMLRELAVSP